MGKHCQGQKEIDLNNISPTIRSEHHGNIEFRRLSEEHGGKNVGSVSKKTSFILAGENMGPEKRKKAENLGVKLITEEQFLSMLNNE